MRLFVAGAAGFLGSALLSACRASGQEAVALVRTQEQAHRVSKAGAQAVVGDLLTSSSYAHALKGCDAVVHLAQASEGELEELRRVRVEGCRTLVEETARAGVRRLVVGSGYWVYASSPSTLVESSELRPLHLSQVNFETEEVARRATRAGALEEAVIARPGMVYGPGSWLGQWVKELKDGSFRYIDDGGNYMSPVHWEDAGRALLHLAERGEAGATYLVVDDDPVTVREFAESVAKHLGAPTPRGLPLSEAKREWGEDLALLNAASRRASNKALRATGWAPKFPSYRDGLTRVLEALR